MTFVDGVRSFLGLRDVRVIVTDRPFDEDYVGYILEGACDAKEGVIYLYRPFTERIYDVIVHELLHVRQARDWGMTAVGEIVIYKGGIYNVSELDYEDRPWERDVISMEAAVKEAVLRRMGET